MRDGDIIELDVAAPPAHARTSPTRSWTSAARTGSSPRAKFGRGYGALYLQHITQANEGCDFDFLEAGPPTPEPEIH